MYHAEILIYNANGEQPMQINYGAFPTLAKAREWASDQVRRNHASQRPVKAILYEVGPFYNRTFLEAIKHDA